MASLLPLHCASRSLWTPRQERRFFLEHKGCSAQLRLRSSSASQASSASSISAGTAIVWFKNDLRLDDHPGLLASTAYDLVLPIYIFDPYMLRWCSSSHLEALVEAVRDLRRALRSLGSDLVIRTGSIRHVLSAVAHQVQASNIITEQEIEHEWNHLLSSVSINLQESLEWGQVRSLQFWTAPLYQCTQLPSSYPDFERLRCAVNLPQHAPAFLPALPQNLNTGNVPQVSNIEDGVRQVFSGNPWQNSFKELKDEGAQAVLKIEYRKRSSGRLPAKEEDTCIAERLSALREKDILAGPSDEAVESRRNGPVMSFDKRNATDGKRSAVSALNRSLRFLEPRQRDNEKTVQLGILDELAERESREGALVRVRHGNALSLGRHSSRSLYQRALEFEKTNGGRWSSFGLSTVTARATIQELKSIEWYQMLARVSDKDSKKKAFDVRIWRWRGFLIQYSVMGSRGPPIVLVHGFGAFGEHYRDNIKGLSGKGSRVWAVTLLGFGRSEKPNITYTELLWAELIRDFIVEVVEEPVTLVGNSIGGYLVSMVAGLWPRIVSNLILLNPAGAVVPNRLALGYLQPRGKSGVTWAAARLIFFYMRGIARRLLKKCYPVNPRRADDWLIEEIVRSSLDPGVFVVLESFLCWRKPLPITWYFDRYKRQVFLIQGSKDPLINPIERAESLTAHCDNVTVKLLNAGHCPHDELPEQVNKLILEWIHKSVLPQKKMNHISPLGKENGSPIHLLMRDGIFNVPESLHTL